MTLRSLAFAFVVLLFSAGCDRDREPSERTTSGAALDQLYDDPAARSPFANVTGLDVRRKERPLRTANRAERRKRQAEAILPSKGDGALGQIVIHQNGTVVLDLLREENGERRLRRIDPTPLAAELRGATTDGTVVEFELTPFGKASGDEGGCYRFRGTCRRVLAERARQLVVWLPEPQDGTPRERIEFRIPATYEPF